MADGTWRTPQGEWVEKDGQLWGPGATNPLPARHRYLNDPRHDPAKTSGKGNPAPGEPRGPYAPAWLSPTSKAVWKRTLRMMIEANIWQPKFADALAQYSVLFADLQNDSASFTGAKWAQLRQYINNLGLTPSGDLNPNRKSRNPNRS
jgi:phage terminase small subunit